MAAWKALAIVGGLAFAGLSGYAMFGPDIEIEISEAQARQKFQEALPISYSHSKAEALVEKADFDFQGDGRVRVTAEVDVQGYGFSGVALADAASGLRYAGGNFYLTDVSLDNVAFRLDGESQQRASDVRAVATSIWNMAKEKAVEHMPESGEAIERLKGEAVAGLSAKTREMVDEALRTTPVYSLNGKGLKESFAVMALEDVRFTANSAIVTLDPGRALGKVLVLVAIVALALLSGVGMMATWGSSRS